MKQPIFRMFFLFPLFHVIYLNVLLSEENILLHVIGGIIVFFIMHNFGPSIGYHKLFAHSAFVPRTFYPYLSVYISMLCFVGGPLGYTIIHSLHHKYADTEMDPHAPNRGRFRAYMGWMLTFKLKEIPKMVLKLRKQYPWMPYVENWDVMILCLSYFSLYMISSSLFLCVLLGGLLSGHLNGLVNAFAHRNEGELNGSDLSLDRPFLAKYLNQVFNHRNHHVNLQNYDSTTPDATDGQVFFIKNLLQKDDKNN